MSGKILWKLLLSVVIVGWAVLNLFPLRDTDFDQYILDRATAHKEEFAQVLTRAQEQVKNKESPTLFVALKNMGDTGTYDYLLYFPDVHVADIKNVKKRNEIILRELLRQSQGKIKKGLDLQGGLAFTLKVDPNTFKESGNRQAQMDKAIEIISRRINGLGVTEPIIRASGSGSIEIQMPGISTRDNPEAIDIVKKPARLEFRKVHRSLNPRTIAPDQYPIGYQILFLEEENRQNGETVEIPLFVKRIPEASGEIVKEAYPSVSQMGACRVVMNFTSEGGKRFAQITQNIAEENQATGTIGQLAIVLDGKLYSAPSVREAILGGTAEISGHFTQREAVELANVLNNPLEFELKLGEMYEVGPSLAEDARASSIHSALLGAGLVIAFMIGYYFIAGVVAVISVLFNLIIVLGTLASLHATLTLPGIAALVLTIGMAVDANILIFERIREELKQGKKLLDALEMGYNKAFSTIIDANLTTLLTAGILIWLGTGPVKGFGLTLAIGIGATMFCSLIISRLLLEVLVNKGWIKNLLHFNLFKETSIAFLTFRVPSFICSWLIVLAGVIALFAKGNHVLGIDFLGGEEITLTFREKLSINDIDQVASEHNLGEVSAVYQKIIGENTERLKIQTEEGHGKAMFSTLKETFPEAGLQLIGENIVGASVSKHITRNAFLAVGVSLLGILLYVAIRFEIGYGIGAIVSTIHDIFMTIGIYVLMGGKFSAPMVAAILMIVGYSINDTIVVFDRIREELSLNPNRTLLDIIHLSINRTLSRTILTSLTTLMAATALYAFGAGTVNDFALVFMIGIITGTFSSIFIASPVFYWWHKGDRRHVEEREFLPKYEWDRDSTQQKKPS